MTLITQFPPASFYFLRLESKYFPRRPDLTYITHMHLLSLTSLPHWPTIVKCLASVLRICKAQEAVTFNEIW